MLLNAVIAHATAAKYFPLLIVELYLVGISIWINDATCDETNMTTFISVWSALCCAAFIIGFTSGYIARWHVDAGIMSRTRRALSCIMDGLMNAMFFVAISMVRAKPWKCFPQEGSLQSYVIGPIALLVMYVGSLVHAYLWIRKLDNRHSWQIISGDINNEDVNVGGVGGDGDDVEVEVQQTTTAADNDNHNVNDDVTLLFSIVILQTRQKVNVSLMILHFLVVAVVIGETPCRDLAGTELWFIAYIAGILSTAFGFRFWRVMQMKLTSNVSRCEHRWFALCEAVITTIHLFSVILMRAKPIKCYGYVGFEMAYTSAVPILLATHAIGLIMTYMWMRMSTRRELIELGHGPYFKSE